MQLDQGNMIMFMKTLIPKTIPNNYQINDVFKEYGEEKDIKGGVLAYRDYLYHLFDLLVNDETIKNTPKKGKTKAYDEVSLSVEYPFLNNIRSILINISARGDYDPVHHTIKMKDFTSLAYKVSLNKNSKVTISNAQMLKALKALEASGLNFKGLDLSVKRLQPEDINEIEVSYPSNPVMMTGLKVLGVAHNEYSDRNNDDILLRSDYRFLETSHPKPESYLNDYTSHLSDDLGDFVNDVHQKLERLGLTCHVEMRMVNYHFMYMNKKKLFARFSASLNQGYRFVIKPTKTSKHQTLINTFPKDLRDTILKGYGCNKKSGSGHGNCENGCAGICFKLDDRLVKHKPYFMKWLEAELAS